MMAALLAAALPERVASAVLLDALWPLPLPVADTFTQLGKFLREYLAAPPTSGGRYRSIEQVVESLCRVTGISARAARPIVERGTVWRDERWQWRVDPRVKLASAFKLSEEQNRLLVEHLTRLPCLLLLAERGFGARLAPNGGLERLAGIGWELLPGSHHFHMEDEAPLIAEKIHRFWQPAG
jgi:pimeloyl-ACP methyl ester carboxylesterase